ncbi:MULTISPECIES: fasciclin domain-containing protein [unclassified Microbacterium]|uniref:fasciclin domain-containing protein n=1 Tax=unclassified Microbacterium TaxID=2609290 RepID=UPI00214AC1FF|nr:MULTISPECIES: fasciclin domain-containing protein [unclassified Microbacterium]MCR2784033.1 fasciclin domain-containing protein [Microbacterium sp. zg.B96]MDL5351049.1 fasciclin domain-containing protein [Microbacterium sp. zg-YB36]WIM17631.1 fasciclin domain-containing protein [Microbacterium sp. zg-B96]
MLSTKKKITAALTLTLAGAFALSACTMGGDTTDEATDTMTEESMTPEAMDATAMLVGAGCEDYAEAVPDGPGSIEEMSQVPVATAASTSPVLTTLTAAVSGQLNPEVNLVETLNGGEYTVFAPVDDAFAKIDEATIESLKTDTDTLTSILTYHVVDGRVDPADIAGTHTTLQGADIEVTGSGDEWMVNDAMVICGGVQTENATVYLLDTVLMPPAQ